MTDEFKERVDFDARSQANQFLHWKGYLGATASSGWHIPRCQYDSLRNYFTESNIIKLKCIT
jgi:hypothetical protein